MTVNNGRGNSSGRGARYRKFSGKATAPLPVTAQPAREGACKGLGTHVFDFGSKDPADLLTTSWDALKVHVGTKYNEDIKMELENGSETTIPLLPKLSEELTRVHEEQWEQQKRRLERILRAKEQAEIVAKTKLIAATEYIVEMQQTEDATVDSGSLEHEVECNMNLTLIQNELDELSLQLATPPKPKLEGEGKSQYDGEWKTYSHRLAELRQYRGLT
jgi:hypothetical protein